MTRSLVRRLSLVAAVCGFAAGSGSSLAQPPQPAAPAASPLADLATIPYQPKAATEGAVRLAGSSTLQQAAAHWCQGFARIHPGVTCSIDTGSALADGKADHATLAAVGAPPGTRRRLGAATAGYVALLGCTVGVVSGLLGAYVLVPLLNGSVRGYWVTPWAMIALVLVGVPLITAAAAWLTTRSSVPLTRRTDT